MQADSSSTSRVFWLIFAVAVLGGLALLGQWDHARYYVVFHCLVELFSIGVAMAIFLIAWNVRRQMDNDFLLFVALAYAAVSLLDLMHTLAYPGMGAIPGVTINPPTQLWIAARYLQALCLVLAPLWLVRRLPLTATLVGLGLIDALVLLLIFHPWPWLPLFPDCHLGAPTGPTPFKVASEYAISALLLVAVCFLWLRRARLDKAVFGYMVAAVFVTMASEIAFTSYVSVTETSNLVGHLLKATAVYLTYRALVAAGLRRPFDVLFRDLSSSEERYRSLFTGMTEGFAIHEVITDAGGRPVDYRFLDVNPAFERLTGLKRQDVVGKTHHQVLPEDDPKWLQMYGQVALTGQPVQFDNYAPTLQRHYEVFAYRPAPMQFAVIFLDITERKRAEDALAESRERLDLALLSARMATFDWNIVQNRRTWGEGVHHLLGTNPETFTGAAEEFFRIIHPDDRGAVQAALTKAVETTAPYEAEYRAVWPDGSIRHIAARGKVHRDLAGGAVRMTGICWDVTERREADAALRQTVDELERSNRELEQFAYISSHDLQEPLRQVQAFVQLLADRHQDKLDGRAAEYLRFVHEGATRMSELVRGLLDYSRVGARDAQRQSTPSQHALDAALANLQASITEAQARITQDDLPTVACVPIQLTQLFQNLIGNAVKFRPDGVPLEIHVGASRDGDRWTFWVKDNGIGIAPQYHEKVFLIFQRLHDRSKYAGTGIGLAICKKIIEQHGGRIWIESEPGRGATFLFTIPDPVA